jgi:hypothetical protein
MEKRSEKSMLYEIMRNGLAVILGVVVGSMVNLAIVALGPMLIPLPQGVDMSDTAKFAENLKLFKPANFLAPWLAHALGTLVGAFLAALLAVRYKMAFALSIGCFFLLGGIAMIAMVGGPFWFAAVDLLGAYLPMGYLGGCIAKNSPQVLRIGIGKDTIVRG